MNFKQYLKNAIKVIIHEAEHNNDESLKENIDSLFVMARNQNIDIVVGYKKEIYRLAIQGKYYELVYLLSDLFEE